MKIRYLSIFVCFSLISSILTGCANFQLKDLQHLWSDGPSEEEAEFGGDPVAAAAARLRSPAGNTAWDSEDERASSAERRYSPPAEHISLGMGMNDVMAIWGEPGDVETAGDPRTGNQRWTYFSGLSSRYGIGSRRVVYFENGRVAGWRKGE